MLRIQAGGFPSMRQKEMKGLLFLALGQQTGAVEGRAQGKVEQDDADGGSYAVHEGDAAGDLGQGLGYGVLLTEDVNVAEVSEERVGEDVQQQAGTGSHDDLDQIAGAVAVEIAELEHLVGHRAAGDADEELQHEGGDGIARITGQDVGQSQTDGTGQTAGHAVQQRAVSAVKVLPRWNEEPP